jgi:hypothetical protein
MTVTRRNVRKCGGFIGTVPKRSFYQVSAGTYYQDENYYARLGDNWPPGYNPVLLNTPKSCVFGNTAASTDPQLSDWGIIVNGDHYNFYATLDTRYFISVYKRGAMPLYLLNASIISQNKDTRSQTLSLADLAFPAGINLHLGSGDNSIQRAWVNRGNYVYQVRFEGTAATTGQVGSPNIVWECSIFKPYQGKYYMEILMGDHARPDGIFGLTDGYRHATFVNFGTITPGQSYVIELNEDGTDPVLHTGYSMGGDYT